jgi:hypothetical protein
LVLTEARRVTAQPPPRATIKVQRPTFDGRTENARGFHASLVTYRDLRAADFPNDEIFIAWTLGCMEGPAVNPWKHSLLNRRATLVTNNQPLPPELIDWAAFLQEFQGKFLDHNEIENAGRALMALRQIRAAREFTMEFNHLAELAGATGEVYLEDQYRRGLKTIVQERILRQRFRDLQELQIASIEWDDALFQFRRQQRTTQELPRRNPDRPQKPTNGSPMDLDYTRLTPEESKKRREAGLCFRCGQAGHIGRNCPSGKGGGKKPEDNQPWRRPSRIAAMERSTSPASETTFVQDQGETTPKGFQED